MFFDFLQEVVGVLFTLTNIFPGKGTKVGNNREAGDGCSQRLTPNQMKGLGIPAFPVMSDHYRQEEKSAENIQPTKRLCSPWEIQGYFSYSNVFSLLSQCLVFYLRKATPCRAEEGGLCILDSAPQ